MSHAEVVQMLLESVDWEHSTQKVHFLEEAVKLADAIPDQHLAYEVRMELVTAAEFSGNYDIAFVAYSWCRNYSRNNPDKVDWQSVIWRLKWIVDLGLHVPSISKAQIEEMLDDLETSVTDNGYSPRPAHGCRAAIYRSMGMLDKAREYGEKWLASPRDSMTDCEACEVHKDVLLKIALGESQRAIEIARPLLEGELSCTTKPEGTYGALMIPLLRLGDVERAIELARIGYPMIRGKKLYIWQLSDFLLLQTRTGQWELAVDNFDSTARVVGEANSFQDQCDFFVAATALLSGFNDVGIESQSLQLPKHWDCHRKDGIYDTAELRTWFDGKSDEIGRQFDARNGTDRFVTRKAEKLALASGK